MPKETRIKRTSQKETACELQSQAGGRYRGTEEADKPKKIKHESRVKVRIPVGCKARTRVVYETALGNR